MNHKAHREDLTNRSKMKMIHLLTLEYFDKGDYLSIFLLFHFL